MSLYQNSVLNKYLRQQDGEAVAKAYKKFVKYFHNPTIQQNIRESKEEQFQEGFLRELFVTIFGYVLNPNANYNLTTELKNEKGAKKADGAILLEGNALAVIELKGTKTKDLESIRQQAFDYKANQTGCVYVITSNFEKLRFYINNAVDFEEFNLFTLTEPQFELFYLCLHRENLLRNVPLKIKEASIVEEEKITKTFYSDYSLFKRELFRDLVKSNIKNEAFRDELNNEDTERADKKIKHALFKKSQKLIDRFLFVFFAEDRGLLPPNSTLKILGQWNKLKDLDAYTPLYDRYKLYFDYLDTGRKGTSGRAEIFAYNGGLFKPDATLNSLLISDDLLYKHTKTLANYDFESQVDVNILGHIFENSLNEIESVNAEIEGTQFDKQKTKRKKDGVFYTPKYITKYIVDNTVGKLCNEKKEELKIVEEEYHPKRQKETKKKLLASLEVYRDWLLQLTILDPACGSGAFLNQALDFLIKEHQYIDELQTNLLGGGFVFPNIENTVLENNIFGVDLNEESVEIAKLSLWLRTAQPRRKLNTLNNNIKCGNSLIDDPKVAGDKAFNWQEEFPDIFKEKDKKAYHITTAIHDSRTSARMKKYKVRERREMGTNPYPNIIYFTKEDDLLITQTIAAIVKEDKLNVLAYNICADHIHLLLVCDIEEVPTIMQKIKGKTSFIHNKGLYKGLKPLAEKEKEKKKPLWQQKYSAPKEVTTQEQLNNTIRYIQNNRSKHELPEHSGQIQQTIQNMCTDYETATKNKEYVGGFDVVIGNPPYVNIVNIEDESYRKMLQKIFNTFKNKCDLYSLFIEKSISLTKTGGELGFIFPNSWMGTSSFIPFRKHISENTKIDTLVELPPGVFKDAVVTTVIMTMCNIKPSEKHKIKLFYPANQIIQKRANTIKLSDIFKTSHYAFSFEKKLELKTSGIKLNDVASFSLGIKTSNDKRFVFDHKIDDNSMPLLRGKNIGKYFSEFGGEYLWYMPELIKEKAGGRPRILEHYLRPKILIQDIAKSINATYDESNSLVNDTINVIYDTDDSFSMYFILGLLNSKAVNKWFRTTFPEGLHIKINQLQEIPIPDALEEQKDLVTKSVMASLKMYEEARKTNSTFTKYLQSQFSQIIPTRKLQNWHKLDFSEFIKELNKAIKKGGGEKLTKMDEMEWMEVFETKKVEALTLEAEIDKTDAEIDAMVYELYGLSEEEIKIVEGN